MSLRSLIVFYPLVTLKQRSRGQTHACEATVVCQCCSVAAAFGQLSVPVDWMNWETLAAPSRSSVVRHHHMDTLSMEHLEGITLLLMWKTGRATALGPTPKPGLMFMYRRTFPPPPSARCPLIIKHRQISSPFVCVTSFIIHSFTTIRGEMEVRCPHNPHQGAH